MNTVVAIDGPAASGKSTVSRRVAQALSFLYVDSGSLYRGVTWAVLREGLAGSETEGVLRVLRAATVSFFVEDGAVRFRINGVEPGLELRTEQINAHVSPVAATEGVRMQVVEWLRGMLALGNLVMEGRDIGTKVFPASPFKFYLDASPEERARRRHKETADALSVTAVGASIRKRDTIDSQRKVDPLKVAEDAIVIDSTALGIDDVVARILSHVRGATDAPPAAGEQA